MEYLHYGTTGITMEDGELKKTAYVPETLNISYDFERREFVVPVKEMSTVFQYCLGNLTKRC